MSKKLCFWWCCIPHSCAIKFGNCEHVSFSLLKSSWIKEVIFFREHLPLLLSCFYSDQQSLFSVFRFKLNRILIISLNFFAQLRCSGIIVIEWNTYPWELNPNPSFVIIKWRLYWSHTIIFSYFTERIIEFFIRSRISHLTNFIHIQIIVLTFGTLTHYRTVTFIFFHIFLQYFQVMTSELFSVHWYINIQLFNVCQNLYVLIRFLLYLFFT